MARTTTAPASQIQPLLVVELPIEEKAEGVELPVEEDLGGVELFEEEDAER